MDVLKKVCDEERQFFFLKWRKDIRSLKKKGSYLFEIKHTSSTMKTGKNIVKSWYF